MKVGDLVELSAYGVSRHYNAHIRDAHPKAIGIVLGFKDKYTYPYKVKWMNLHRADDPRAEVQHMRRELRYAQKCQ